MALSRALAAAIVRVIDTDPECKRRIDSVFKLVPGGAAGSVRNMKMIIQNMVIVAGANALMLATSPPSGYPARSYLKDVSQTYGGSLGNITASAKQEHLVCSGISDATAAALNRRVGRAGPGGELFQVASADSCGRMIHVDHTATSVTMKTHQTYVFDWHASLNAGNPWIYPSLDAFERGRDKKEFRHFIGTK